MPEVTPKLDRAFLNELRRIITERQCSCPRCGYNLSGVPGPRCPECGKNVTEYLRVADTTPWRLPQARRRAAWQLALKIVMIPLGVTIALVLLIAAAEWAS